MQAPRKRKPRAKPAPRPGDVVRVEWNDAWFDSDLGLGPMRTSCPAVTVGFLLDRPPGDGVVSVASEQFIDGWRAVSQVLISRSRRGR